MSLKEFIEKYNWKAVDIDWVYWHQWEDLVKRYAIDVLWIKLQSFWGSAKNGWNNTYNTFSESQFEKITDKSKFQVWDIIFWDRWKYWHVAIITKIFWNWMFEAETENDLMIMWDYQCILIIMMFFEFIDSKKKWVKKWKKN